MRCSSYLAVGIIGGLLAGAVQARPGIVRTRAGGTYQGGVTWSLPDQGVWVELPSGGKALVSLADLASALFEPAPNPTTPATDWCIVFRSSAMAVPVAIGRATAAELQLESGGAKFKAATLDLAGILFQAAEPSQISALQTGRPGVILRTGDFIDGEFRGFDGQQVVLNSVLFGIRRLLIGKEAVAVVLHALPSPAARYQVRTSTGRVFCSPTLPTLVAGDRLLVADPVWGENRVPFDDVLEIRTAPR